MKKKVLLRFTDGHIVKSDKGMISYLSSNPIIESIEITGKSEKEIKEIKKELTKKAKESKIKKADDLAAKSDKKTLQ